MFTDNAVPLALLKANLELQLRVAQLLHENSQRWLELSSRFSREGINEYKTDIGNLAQAENWQTFVVLPADTFWRQLQKRFVDSQDARKVAVDAQSAFTQGLQQAIQAWQKATTGCLDPATAKLPVPDFFKSWGANWATVAADTKTGAAHAS